MAPPRRTTPAVMRSIQFEPSDIVALAAVQKHLGEPDGSSTIRRLIRDAYEGVPATVEAPKVDTVAVKVGDVLTFADQPSMRVTAILPKPKRRKAAPSRLKGERKAP